MAYRLLQQGDTIQRSDEVLNDDCETWDAAHLITGGRLFIGLPFNPAFFMPMRRSVDDGAAQEG